MPLQPFTNSNYSVKLKQPFSQGEESTYSQSKNLSPIPAQNIERKPISTPIQPSTVESLPTIYSLEKSLNKKEFQEKQVVEQVMIEDRGKSNKRAFYDEVSYYI